MKRRQSDARPASEPPESMAQCATPSAAEGPSVRRRVSGATMPAGRGVYPATLPACSGWAPLFGAAAAPPGAPLGAHRDAADDRDTPKGETSTPTPDQTPAKEEHP